MRQFSLAAFVGFTAVFFAPLGVQASQAKIIASPTCRPPDFRSFFEQTLRPASFRKFHLAANVRQRRGSVARNIPRARYTTLPITIMDTFYVTTTSALGNSRNWETVSLDINMGRYEQVRVDWVRVKMDRAAEGDEGTRAPDVTYGPRGYLIFTPAGDCWQLTDDVVE